MASVGYTKSPVTVNIVRPGAVRVSTWPASGTPLPLVLVPGAGTFDRGGVTVILNHSLLVGGAPPRRSA